MTILSEILSVTSSLMLYKMMYYILEKMNPRNSLINSRIVSLIHAVFVTILSLDYLILGNEYNTVISSELYCNRLQILSIGYFILDMMRTIKDRKYYKKYHVISFILHHILCILSFFGYHRLYPIITAKLYLSELSTPFVHIEYFISTFNHKILKKLRVMNGTITLLLFFIFRIVNYTNLFVWSMDKGLFEIVGITLMLSMNCLWFFEAVYKSLLILNIIG